MARPAEVTVDYKIIKSRRKTIAIEIKPDGSVIVRCPLRIPQKTVDSFVESKRQWIENKLKDIDSKASENIPKLSVREIKELTAKAKDILPSKVEYYANLLGVSYGRISVKCQRTLWGSCSSKGNLNFNCLLMLTPEDITDYVVVHELAHRLHMNHSKEFWSCVESILPDYKQRRKWLKKNGASLMRAAIDNTAESRSYYTYMVRCADGSLYTGYTTDLSARLAAHNSGKGAKYTRSRLPVSLVYYESFPDKWQAQSREALIKQLTKAQKEALIRDF